MIRKHLLLVGLTVLLMNVSMAQMTVYAQGQQLMDEVKEVITNYVEDQSEETGAFLVENPDQEKTHRFSFVEFHKSIKSKDGVHTLCVDFKDLDTDEVYDVDFDVSEADNKLAVENVRLHKLVIKEDASKTEDVGKGSKGSQKGS